MAGLKALVLDRTSERSLVHLALPVTGRLSLENHMLLLHTAHVPRLREQESSLTPYPPWQVFKDMAIRFTLYISILDNVSICSMFEVSRASSIFHVESTRCENRTCSFPDVDLASIHRRKELHVD